MIGEVENLSWIIDTGASAHMMGNWDNLSDLHQIFRLSP